MDFVSTIIFLALYYIRPHEWPWLGLLKQLKPIQMVTIFGMVAMLRRPGGIRKSDFLQTPHDWFMLIFFLFIVVTSGRIQHTFMELLPVFIFYLITVQSLRTMKRLERFLTCWVLLLLVLATMALLSLVGFDPTHSLDTTKYYMKGRLILGTSLFNNPNALGHTVVAAIPLTYYLYVWKRPVFVKIPCVFLILLPAFCVFLTASKGAFLAGGVTLLLGMLFKRHWVLQGAFLLLTFGIGIGLIQKLPRMNEFSKSEGGIQGREAAFKYGYQLVTEEAKLKGVGYKNYYSSMQAEYGKAIATHGSYNEVGATTGQIGLFIYLGILYMNMRILLLSKVRTVREDRVQRLLFIFVVSFGMSAWVVDWAFRATYFMTAGAVAAFHRLMLKSKRGEIMIEKEAQAPAPAEWAQTELELPSLDLVPESPEESSAEERKKPKWTPFGIRWEKVGILDIVLMFCLLRLCLFCWGMAVEMEF